MKCYLCDLDKACGDSVVELEDGESLHPVILPCFAHLDTNVLVWTCRHHFDLGDMLIDAYTGFPISMLGKIEGITINA